MCSSDLPSSSSWVPSRTAGHHDGAQPVAGELVAELIFDELQRLELGDCQPEAREDAAASEALQRASQDSGQEEIGRASCRERV